MHHTCINFMITAHALYVQKPYACTQLIDHHYNIMRFDIICWINFAISNRDKGHAGTGILQNEINITIVGSKSRRNNYTGNIFVQLPDIQLIFIAH